MSSTSDKLRGLVEHLYSKTISEKLDWNLSSDKGRVNAAVAEYHIELSEEPSDRSFETDIRVTVYNNAGDLVDTFTDQAIREYTPVIINMSSYYTVLSNCFEVARRQASGADKAIISILTALEGGPVSDPVAKPHFGGAADDLDDDVPF